MTRVILLFPAMLFCFLAQSQVHWISPSSGIHKYQSVAAHEDRFYALFNNNLLISADSFRTRQVVPIPDSVMSLLERPRLFIRDSASFFISCQYHCSSAIYTLDGGKKWAVAGKGFRHFHFDSDSTTAADTQWLYAFDNNNGQWKKIFRPVSNLPDEKAGRYQLFGDSLITVRNGQLSIHDGRVNFRPSVGHKAHEDFRFFDSQRGFVATRDSVYYTSDGGVTFRNAGPLSFGVHTFPAPGVVVQVGNLDSLAVTTDAGNKWQMHYMPRRFGGFMPANDLVVLGGDILFDPYTLTYKNLLHAKAPRDFFQVAQVEQEDFFLFCQRDTSYRLNLVTEELEPVYAGPLEFYNSLRFGGFHRQQGLLYDSELTLITSDGGATWEPLKDPAPFFVAVHWTGRDQLLGATKTWDDEAVFHRSEDGGKNWEVVHTEENAWPPVTALMSFDEHSFIADVNDNLIYYETWPDSLYKRPLRKSGIRTHLSRIDDSTAVLLDYSWGNSFTRDKGKTWKPLPDYPYAPFEEYSLRTTADEKVVIYNSTLSTISYCWLGDTAFTTEKIDAPSAYGWVIVNDSTLLMAGPRGLIWTYRPQPEFSENPAQEPSDVDEHEVTDAAEIVVHPNPAKDWLQVSFSPEFSGGSWVISSYSGQVLDYGDLPSGTEHRIELGTLTPGLYILNLRKGSQSGGTRFLKEF